MSDDQDSGASNNAISRQLHEIRSRLVEILFETKHDAGYEKQLNSLVSKIDFSLQERGMQQIASASIVSILVDAMTWPTGRKPPKTDTFDWSK